MNLNSNLGELNKKHEMLSLQIEEVARHPAADDLKIRELKRLKLNIKEEIARKSARFEAAAS